MDRYLKGLLDPFVSLLEIHKLMYFLKAAGETFDLPLKKASTDRILPTCGTVLIRMEKHLTRGFGEGSDKPTTPVELLPGAVKAAEACSFQPS